MLSDLYDDWILNERERFFDCLGTDPRHRFDLLTLQEEIFHRRGERPVQQETDVSTQLWDFPALQANLAPLTALVEEHSDQGTLVKSLRAAARSLMSVRVSADECSTSVRGSATAKEKPMPIAGWQ